MYCGGEKGNWKEVRSCVSSPGLLQRMKEGNGQFSCLCWLGGEDMLLRDTKF